MESMTSERLKREIDRIKSLDAAYLLPKQIAPVLGVDAQHFRIRAREHPEEYHFQIIRSGKRVKTPKKSFLAWAESLI